MILDPTKRLADYANSNLETISLEDLAYLVAKEKYPDIDISLYRERMDEFARRAALRIGEVIGSRQIAQGLSQYLFEEEGFRGNTLDYYHPSNSYLNDVLDRREGIPITLSIFYMAIAERLKLPVSGVAFPGHFLVRYEDPQRPFFIDTFYRGKLLMDQDCHRRLTDLYGDTVPFRHEFLHRSSHRDILFRLLANLKINYMMRKDFEMALKFLNLMVIFNPHSFDEIKERGLIYYHLECFGLALKDLELFLDQKPETPDRPLLEECIEDLRHKIDHIQ